MALLTLGLANQEEAVKSQEAPYSEVFIVERKELDLKEYVKMEAKKYGLDFRLVDRLIQCESGWWPNAIGDSGQSIGLYQIHLPAHPQITKEQALDPIFSTKWAMPKLKETPEIWTCYNNLISL